MLSAARARTREADPNDAVSYVWKGRTLGRRDPGRRDDGRAPGRGASTRSARSGSSSPRSRRSRRGSRSRCRSSAAGVSTKDLAIFTRQFATMITAGLPLVQCLDILVEADRRSRCSARSSREVMREVEAGSTLADALGKHKNVFDELFVQHGRGRRGGRYPGRHPACASRPTSRRPTRSSARSRAP